MSTRGPSACQDSDNEETPGMRAAIIAWNARAALLQAQPQPSDEGEW